MPPYVPRVAIITGAAQGIGLSIARQLAKDGIDVAVNDIPAKSAQIDEVVNAIKETGRKAIAIPADVTSEEEVQKMVETTARELGSVDIVLFLFHSTFVSFKCTFQATAEIFDAVTAVNFKGVFLCYQHAAKQMIKEGHGGRIIVNSVMAKSIGFPNLSVYSGTKFAVRGITQVAAKELGEHGITVNAYAPGIILTPLSIGGGTLDEKLKLFKEAIGIPSYIPHAEPEVIGNLVSFLCKPESHFITGRIMFETCIEDSLK
ncbi:NAD-binding protein [Schizopora paradoxa]|uniref:NAD-binding protein n=1 Tax=Schizopora paradoxa TaxID=27342 RepID=A0A0H2R8P3_9AGAM|nr:NAD-binding protein [Schizopora paradoxa]